MIGFNGGLIGPQRTPSDSDAVGVWTLQEQELYKSLVNWPSTGDITCLMNFNGNNNSTVFVDSAAGASFSSFGNVKISTADSKFGGASLLCDGTGDYLQSPQSSIYTFGTGPFTVEMWLKRLGTALYIRPFSFVGGTGAFSIEVSQASTGTAPYTINTPSGRGTAYNVSADITQWQHIAVTRSSGITRLFVAGQMRHKVTDTANYSFNQVLVGRLTGQTGYDWNGYIDDFRIVKGVNVYPGDGPITVPSSELTTTL